MKHINRPKRLRRSQLAVPGVSEKMLTKAAASNADHVFCDLEDAVAPEAKADARAQIAAALIFGNRAHRSRSCTHLHHRRPSEIG